ncbi:MAG TPA: elongation factor G [Anaerovoracaceae bacterium]|nr:elongation factor G [Anaerovoracaceae bacterium]
MKGYKSETIRNVALLGHGGCGKTTFLEAALLATGVINRLGKVEDGNTVSDYDKMEIEKGYSIGATIVPVEYNKVKINFVDTPGFFDFVGEVNSAMRAVEAALILVDASSGIQVGTEKAWQACRKYDMPKFFVISKADKENVDVAKTVEDLKAKFGTSVATLDDRDTLSEAIAETDEELMEKYFDAGEFTDEEFAKGLSIGIASGDIVPVLDCTSVGSKGITEILDAIIKYVQQATAHAAYPAKNGKDEDIEVKCDPAGKPAAFVFKTIADPFLGKISLAKVISGQLKMGTEIYNARAEKPEKLGSMFFMRGSSHGDAQLVEAGDIVAIAKLQFTKTGDTLCEKANIVQFPPVDFPQPSYFIAVEAAAKGEDEKLASGLHKLMEEDPSFVLERNVETHQSLLGGQGDIQLSIIQAKLKDKFSVLVKTIPQKIAYRETIKGSSDVQGKHKKQSGGAGQYGDVHIKFSPSQEPGLEFSEELFGGSIPKNYVPAVEKGLLECMEKGPLAGCKVQNVKAVLYDGSYHDVDSNEVAFKIAASLAFKKGIVEAKPCLLEPVMHVEILVLDDYTGDVMGDMNKRRGKILGMEPTNDGQKLMAEAPQSELFDYAIVLRAMTQARGTFTMNFERYEEVPMQLAEKIIANHKAEEEA